LNRFGTKLCSIVLCAAMLGPMMSGPGAPSASAEGLFGGLSLSERLQSRRAERGSLLDRLAQGREERQAGAEALLEAAGNAAEGFRESHPELAAGADEARESLREAADGLRENLEQGVQGIGGAEGSGASGAGDAQAMTAGTQSETGETPAAERFVLDVTKRIDERRAEREAQTSQLQDGLENVIVQIDASRAEAEERVTAVRDELESGIAQRTASPSLLTEGNPDGQSGTEPDGGSSVLDNLRERIAEVRQQLEENRDNWTQPEEKLEELRTRVEEIRAQLEEAANSEGGGNSRVEELRQQIREMEEKIQQAKEESAEKRTALWRLKNWIAHPEAMLIFRVLQRLSTPKEHKTVERAQRDTSATGAANYQPAASPVVSPSPSPSPTPEPPAKKIPLVQEKEEEIEEEEIPLALPEPVPMKVTPWYVKPEFIIAMCTVAALGGISVAAALRAGTASAHRKKESGQTA